MNTWITPNCPYCSRTNWINEGDVSDITKPDVEVVQCWNCSKKWMIDRYVKEGHSNEVREADFENLEDHYEYETWQEWIENAGFCEKGRKNPEDPGQNL